MHVMARPSTLTPEIASQLCAARRVGATLKASAGAVGVPYRTLMDWLRLGRAEGAEGPYADLARGLDAAPTAPAAPPRGTGRAHTRPNPAEGTDGPSLRHGAASSCADLTRLRVLWYSLRAAGLDLPGPPGIDYTRDRVQTSPACPTTPHGYGTGHAVDRVALRLAAIARTSPEAARTLLWYRGHPAQADLDAGRARAILGALVTALATPGDRAAWAASAPGGADARAVLSHVEAAGRAWARARMGAAWSAWAAA